MGQLQFMPSTFRQFAVDFDGDGKIDVWKSLADALASAANYLGGKYLQDCTLYVTLEPCSMCAGALYWSQIGRVVYGASDEHRGFRVKGGELHPKTKFHGGVLEEDCAAILQDFFRSKRKN